VNLALPAVTNTRLASKLNVIGLAGSDLQISASNFPGTKTFPGCEISAFKVDFADVSKSDPESVISLLASITIPSSAVVMGLFEIDLETQLTASTKLSLSTTNFIYPPSLFYLENLNYLKFYSTVL
jgi:hypothetical protein